MMWLCCKYQCSRWLKHLTRWGNVIRICVQNEIKQNTLKCNIYFLISTSFLHLSTLKKKSGWVFYCLTHFKFWIISENVNKLFSSKTWALNRLQGKPKHFPASHKSLKISSMAATFPSNVCVAKIVVFELKSFNVYVYFLAFLGDASI